MSQSPYVNLPAKSYWRTGVAAYSTEVPENLYTPKWELSRETPIATAGSCFAQHIGRTLREVGFNIMDVEPAPADLAPGEHLQFGYSMYSGRYGNIYTIRQMLQLAHEAFGITPMSTEVWETKTSYVDALRPTIDPDGFGTPEAVHMHRKRHLAQVREMLLTLDVFVFTFGLTETWLNSETGVVYPVCPGTIAGEFDPEIHKFHNFTYTEVLEDFLTLRDFLIAQRPDDRAPQFLVTVSPVPLTATASPHHVQVSTVYSKSVLRSVAGYLCDTYADVDYFPSYEIITSPWSEVMLYEPNKRSVTSAGVAAAMNTFMLARNIDGHTPAPAAAPKKQTPVIEEDADMLVKCDEELLEAFGPRDA